MSTMARYRSARSYFNEYVSDPQNARRFAESEIALAVTRLLTRLRKDAGLTQSQLAERIGRRQAYVAKLEGGAYDRCSLPTLRTFARALGYDIDIHKMIRPLPEPVYAADVAIESHVEKEMRLNENFETFSTTVQAAVVQCVEQLGAGSLAPSTMAEAATAAA